MARKTVTVKVTLEVEDYELDDLASRAADAVKHEVNGYWAYAELED